MGAVIGGLYASGMSASEIEKALAGLDLTDVAFDRDQRKDQPQDVRQDAIAYPVGFPVGFGASGLKSPSGFVQGNQLLALLQLHTGRIPSDADFDTLPVPFRAVATDLETGDMVVLRRGSLPQAIRASMAVPGLFTPEKLDGRALIDGGVVRNLPVDIAKEMGADIVIAVNIGTPLKKAAELTSMGSVTQQMIATLISQNVKAQKALLGASDILLEPELGNLSFVDFASARAGIDAGALAIQPAQAKLAALALSAPAYASFMAGRSQRAFLPDDTRIDHIEVATDGRVPVEHVRRAIHAKAGQVYDPVALNRDLGVLNSQGDLETASATFRGSPGDRVLEVDATSKSWGPNFLLFGAGLVTNFNGDGAYAVRIGHRLPWITESGLSWRNDIVLGSRDVSLQTELRQPIFWLHDAYLAPFASVKRSQADVYLDEEASNPKLDARYRVQELRVGLNAGLPLGRLGEIRAGIAQVHTGYNLTINAPSVVYPADGGAPVIISTFPQSISSNQTVGRVELEIDQLDAPLFPRHGYYVDGYAEIALDQGEGHYNTAHLRAMWADSIGPHSVNVAIEGGGQFGGQSGEAYNFSIGGFQHLAAYADQQFSGSYILYGHLTYMAELRHSAIGMMQSLFAGASLEAGNVWSTAAGFGRGQWRSSASVFLGTKTSIGPVYLGFAIAPGGTRNIYFQLGNQF
jgi:NTE family protein